LVAVEFYCLLGLITYQHTAVVPGKGDVAVVPEVTVGLLLPGGGEMAVVIQITAENLVPV
jgi:hypothetical protein